MNLLTYDHDGRPTPGLLRHDAIVDLSPVAPDLLSLIDGGAAALAHARALAAMLPAAELVIAPDTGHMPHRLRTDLVIAAIRRVNEMTSASAAD